MRNRKNILASLVLMLLLSMNVSAFDLVLDKWTVVDGKLDNHRRIFIHPRLPQNTPKSQQAVWDYFNSLFPQDTIRKYFSRFQIETDKIMGNLAAIEPDKNARGKDKWVLVIDIVDAVDEQGNLMKRDLAKTLLHEFAHILTLNSLQISPRTYRSHSGMGSLLYYVQDLGIPKSSSYLYKFIKQFWTEGMLDRALDNQFKAKTPRRADKLAEKFYQDYKDKFVSKYAATNPEEDIAETWKDFIIFEKPKGNTINQQKIRFFYQFPEMVEMRKTIQAILRK